MFGITRGVLLTTIVPKWVVIFYLLRVILMQVGHSVLSFVYIINDFVALLVVCVTLLLTVLYVNI
jgi:hypothetical protein